MRSAGTFILAARALIGALGATKRQIADILAGVDIFKCTRLTSEKDIAFTAGLDLIIALVFSVRIALDRCVFPPYVPLGLISSNRTNNVENWTDLQDE